MKHLILALTIVLLGSACSAGGKSNYPKPTALPEQFQNQVQTEILWSKKLNLGDDLKRTNLIPATDGKNIYAVGAEGDFYSLDAISGKENYRKKLKNKISAGVTVVGNYAFIGTQNGDLMALNTTNAQVMWRSSLGSMMLAPATFGEGILAVFTTGGDLLALNPEDGSILWRYHTEMPILSMQGTAAPVVGGGVVIITDDNAQFVVLDAKTGLPVANQKIERKTSDNLVGKIIDQDATAKINNGILFASSYQNRTYAVNLAQGGLLWENDKATTRKGFAIDPTNLYLVSGYDEVVALNQQTGAEVWRNKKLIGRRLAPLAAIMPNYIFTIDVDGNLIWLSSRTGELLGIHRIGKTASNSEPLLMSERIIWQLLDGRLVAFRPR